MTEHVSECKLPEGEVIDVVSPDTFVVLVKRSTACQGCRGCGMLSSDSDVRVVCAVDEHSTVHREKVIKGTLVHIEPLDVNIMGIAALVYTIPLLTFIFGLGGAKVLGLQDMWCLVTGFILLGTGFIPAGIVNRKYSEKKRPFFRIKTLKKGA